jgi:hypothetical protein
VDKVNTIKANKNSGSSKIEVCVSFMRVSIFVLFCCSVVSGALICIGEAVPSPPPYPPYRERKREKETQHLQDVSPLGFHLESAHQN